MSYDFQVVIDTNDPHTVADWWADALRWELEPSDEAFIRRMVAEGLAVESDTITHNGVLVWESGQAIRPIGTENPRRILFQRVPEPKITKNRLHLDVRVGADNIEDELKRLSDAGATFLHRGHEGPHHWVTMADPWGNEFCLA